MTQLILDGIQLPESQDRGYYAHKIEQSVSVEMISGRMVKEVRGDVWEIQYQYGFLEENMKNKLIAACDKGRREPILCGFLPQDSNGELKYSSFFVTDFHAPDFMWSKDGKPMWADFAVTLREVKPSD